MNVPPESLTMLGNTKLDRAEMTLRRAEKHLAEARNDRDQAKVEFDKAKKDQTTMMKQWSEEKDPTVKKVLKRLLDVATEEVAAAQKHVAVAQKKVADTEQDVNEKDARVNKAEDNVSQLLTASNGNDNGTTMSFVGPLSCSPRCRCCLSSSSYFFFVLELQFLFFSVLKARRKRAI